MSKNDVVVITGAAKGIGKATALAFAREGAQVVLGDLELPMAERVAEEIRQNGGIAAASEVDVTDRDSAYALIDKAVSTFGGADVLVNNAGIVKLAAGIDVEPDDWDRIMGVNLKGALFCMQRCAKFMIEQGHGRIINVASVAGLVPRVNKSAYCASKAGLIHLTKVWALELAKHRITVNCACPGSTATEMNLGMFGPERESKLARLESCIPFGRLATVEEQTGLILFLASQMASWITGQVIAVDGGQSLNYVDVW